MTTAASGPAASRRVTRFDVTDSTNTRALAAIGAGAAADGEVFIAARQTAGRGTGGKAWDSSEPAGLWMSIALADPLRVRPLSLWPAVAIASLLRRGYGVPAHLKWPNDVLVGAADQTRKIAGILIESCQSLGRRWWVVGIGVNLNQPRFPPPLEPIATSLRMCCGAGVDPAAFFEQLMGELDRLSSSGDLPGLWMELSRMPGRTVTLCREGAVSAVRVEGVDDDGHLRIIAPDGARQSLIGIAGLDISPRY